MGAALLVHGGDTRSGDGAPLLPSAWILLALRFTSTVVTVQGMNVDGARSWARRRRGMLRLGNEGAEVHAAERTIDGPRQALLGALGMEDVAGCTRHPQTPRVLVWS